MYLVKINNNGVETIINSISPSNSAPRITGTIKLGINTIDSFTFTIYPNNPGYNKIYPLATLIEVINTITNKIVFKGRVLVPTDSMENSGLFYRSYICESELGYLNDSQQRYGEYHNISPKDYLKKIIDTHNKEVDKSKQFKLGNVTVKDNNDSLYRYMDYDTSFKNIESDLISSLGGELQIRYEGNERYIDYLTEIGEVSETKIKLSRNMQSIKAEKDATAIITRLIPLGSKLENSDERLTISDVNNGADYIDDEEGIKEFGIIEGTETWDNVTDANTLLKKGKVFLSANNKITKKYSITALDLSLIGLDIDSIEVGNYYQVENTLLGINDLLRVVEKSISIESPESSTIDVGEKQDDIKTYHINANKAQNNINKIEKELKSVSTTLLTVNETVNNVTATVNTIENNLNSTDSNLIDVVNAVNGLTETVNNNAEALNELIDYVELVAQSVTENKLNITEIKNTVSEITSSIFDLDESIKTLSLKYDSLDERLKILEGDDLNG